MRILYFFFLNLTISQCFLLNNKIVLFKPLAIKKKILNPELIMSDNTKITNNLIIYIDNIEYNLSSWQFQHPGGYKILQKFNNSDATQAFYKFKHSEYAMRLLDNFRNNSSKINNFTIDNNSINWRNKLFTKEDKYNIHKFLGIYCLLHFFYRYTLCLTDDIYGGINKSYISIISILIHGLLSLSSLKFYVPKERINTKPMIWQEFRAHNIIFAWRSILCCLYLWIGLKFNIPKLSIFLCTNQVFNSLYSSDMITKQLRINNQESTTSTMPYWDNCNLKTQQKFKYFYSYCQYLATLSCISGSNIIWPFITLLPIQLASFLMTLVRKGLLTTKKYHYIYTFSLCLPFIVGIYHSYKMKTVEVLIIFILGHILLFLRKLNLNKYLIWMPILLVRNLY